MIEKGKWVVLPYLVAKGLPGLKLSHLNSHVDRKSVVRVEI